MSYCRFSTDDFRCDVYCYPDCGGGFTTHVAGNRHVLKEPLPDRVSYKDDRDAWFARHKEVSAMIDAADLEPIGLPHDGADFNDPTLDAMLDRLKMLKAEGYIVPDFVLESIEEELKEGE